MKRTMKRDMSNERLIAWGIALAAIASLVLVIIGYCVLWAAGWQTGANTLGHLEIHFTASMLTALLAGTVALTGAVIPTVAFVGLLGGIYSFIGLISWGYLHDGAILLKIFPQTAWPATLLFCAIVLIWRFLQVRREAMAS
jgi:hypothetical protein